jgi:hypothetical protein
LRQRIYSKGCLVLLFGFIIFGCVFAEGPQQREEANLHNPFGVLEFLNWNNSWNNYKYPSELELGRVINLIKESGAGWVRMDFLWEEIEPKQGEFSFEKYDRIVELVSKNNLNILGLLDYNASWDSLPGGWNSAPQENKNFVNYAQKVISRYKDKVKYWELWNEPDSSIYWVPQDGLKRYCSLLKDVYIAAKKVDPDCKILNGGLTEGAVSINQLYDNGAKEYFDILNIHIFETPLNPGAIESVKGYAGLVREIMLRNSDGNKTIWVTEIGCPGLKDGIKTGLWWLGKNPDEEQQAAWVSEVYAGLLKLKYIDKVFWAFFRDCQGHWGDGTDYFGLVRWDYSKKPSFKSFQDCFSRWRNSNGDSFRSKAESVPPLR